MTIDEGRGERGTRERDRTPPSGVRRDVIQLGQARSGGEDDRGADAGDDGRSRSTTGAKIGRHHDGGRDEAPRQSRHERAWSDGDHGERRSRWRDGDGGGRPRADRSDDRGERGGRDRSGEGSDREEQGTGRSGDRKSEPEDDGAADDDAGAELRRKKRRPLILAVIAVVAVLMVGGGLYYWLSTRGKVYTDDAYTDGNIVTIAPQVAGQVVSLDVTDNQFVRKGDPLIHIDARQYVYSQEQAQGQLDSTKAQAAGQRLGVEIARKNFPAALELAKANLAQAQATLVLQQANYDRQKSLPKLATTQQDVDTNAANYQQAKAQVEQAKARVTQAEPVQQNIDQSQEQVSQIQGQFEQAQGRLDQAKLNVEWSVVRAPQDGWVTRRNVNAGDYLTAGQQILSLVTTDVWITANYKETQLDGMRPGQAVEITVDAYPDLRLRGHVDSIQRGSGSKFSAFPAQNATGNFVKIVQRVPVKIVIDSGLKPDEPLPLGISVEPTVMLK